MLRFSISLLSKFEIVFSLFSTSYDNRSKFLTWNGLFICKSDINLYAIEIDYNIYFRDLQNVGAGNK